VIWPSWEQILKDSESGKAVWLVRGKCGWAALVIRQVVQHEAHCILLKRCSHACDELSVSLKENGFDRVSINAKGGKIRWANTGNNFTA
jgi:hypothetical protein